MRIRTSLWLVAASFTAAGCSSAGGEGGPTLSPATSLTTVSSDVVAAAGHKNDGRTVSPIKHVIVIIGENRTFDHLFATYEPKRGEKVDNLLSKKIITEKGTPGVNFSRAAQFTAVDAAPSPWEIAPGSKTLYGPLPPPHVPGGDTSAPFATIADAKAAENGLPDDYYTFLTTGGTGLPGGGPDTRIANVNSLLPGPFQLTGPTLTDDDYAGSPVHRFYQMWQQLDCSAAYATAEQPVRLQVGLCGRGWSRRSRPVATAIPSPPAFAGEGSTAMEFYNMLQGDIAYTKRLADEYTISDNFHQSVEGGTGANHVMMMSGDAHLVQRRQRQRGRAARRPDREPRPARGHEQLVHAGRLLRAARTASAPTRPRPGVSEVVSYLAFARAPGRSELRERPLLPSQQLRARLLRRRHRQHGHVRHPAVAAPHDRRRAAREGHLVGATSAISSTTTSRTTNLYDTPTTSTATSATASSTRRRS